MSSAYFAVASLLQGFGDFLSNLPAYLFPYKGDGNDHESPAPGKPERQTKDKKEKRVLILSRFGELALYRAELLRERGFSVWLPKNTEEAKATIDRGEFDIAVFSYTLPNDTVHELTDRIRSMHPGRPLVAVSNSGVVDGKIRPDETVLATDGPAGLIAALRKLLKQQ